MLISYASDTAVGLYAEKLALEPRAENPTTGAKRIVIGMITLDPAGRGEMVMSEDEARKLRDDLDKLLPRLAAVRGNKP